MKLEKTLSNLPNSPGIYIFRDKYDRIIYIGKAINLRSRVRSYWNESSAADRPKLKIMVPKIHSLETIITKSEKEALILESNLVFKHQPRYNVLLKDNKSFPWLVINYDEEFPRLLPVRNIEKFKKFSGASSKNKYFGPYTNSGAMYENLELVRELFPLRRKKVPPFKNRPCLNYDLGKCLGPCQGLVSRDDYHAMLSQVEILLKGHYQDLKFILEEEMNRASENLEYEKAAKIRDRIYALSHFNERQNVISQDERLDQDVFVLVFDEERDYACLQVFKTRAGKLINRDTLEFEFESDDKDEEILESVFLQYYSQIPDQELPKEILLSHKFSSEELQKSFEELLGERKGSKVTIHKPSRGDKLASIELARKNGKIILEKMKLEALEEKSKDINLALENLRKELGLSSSPERIECFDVSHIQGTNVVGSMVTFIGGLPEKRFYKRFKLSKDQNNDFESMAELVRRRYKIYSKENPIEADDSLPNLIIIDGGKGQLKAAKDILLELGLGYIKIIGLAKREEEIFFPDEKKPVILDRKSPELFLIQRIRNEAHRFAISYHRNLRSKKSLESLLDEIPGIGPKKKKLLLEKFGTLKKIQEAKIEEIAELPSFSKELAENLFKNIKTHQKPNSLW